MEVNCDDVECRDLVLAMLRQFGYQIVNYSTRLFTRYVWDLIYSRLMTFPYFTYLFSKTAQ
jgi:hypothetical protein